MKNSLFFKTRPIASLRFYPRFLAFVVLCFMALPSFGQLVSSGYGWSEHDDMVYTALPATAPTITLGGTGASLDNAIFPNIPIGFLFNFNGTDYTTLGISTNGFVWFGNTNPAITEYNPISSTTAMSGVISGFAANLVGRLNYAGFPPFLPASPAGTLRYSLSTTCPRVLTIQWNNMQVVGIASAPAPLDPNRIDIEIKLTEGSNGVAIIVHNQPYLLNAPFEGQLGLRGATNTDFANRTIDPGDEWWYDSFAGPTNASIMTMFPTYPPLNFGYRYTPTATSNPISWTGAPGADWFTATNWSPAQVPNSYNSVAIPANTSVSLSGATNAICRSLTIAAGASLTTAATYTGRLNVAGSITNNGTITTNGAEHIFTAASQASTIGGTGNFAAADIAIASGACGVYSLANNVLLRQLHILAGSTLNMSGFNLTAVTRINQIGTINQGSGTLQIEDVLPTLTNATFNENTGTTFFATGTNSPNSTQVIPSITYNHLRINARSGFFALIADVSVPISCNNLEINNPAPVTAIANVRLRAPLTVTGTLDLGLIGNTFVFNLDANLTIGSAGVLRLHRGIMNTTTFDLLVTNGAAAAIVAGTPNPNYSLSYVTGTIRRTIGNAVVGQYDFPLGDATTSRYLAMDNNGLSGGGFNLLVGRFIPLINHTDAAMTANEPLEAGVTYGSLANEGVWFLGPNSQPISGTYNLRAYINGIAGLVDNQFGLLRRNSGSISGADWNNGGTTATRPATSQPGRTLASGFAMRNDLTSFNHEFGIGRTAVVASTNLGIIKRASNLAPIFGSNISFTLRAFNGGPSAATNVIVRDTLPAGYTFVSSTPAGVYNPPTHTWTVGNLANGDTATLTIVASVRLTGPYANTAHVSGTQTDPVLANNRSTATPIPTIAPPDAINDTINTFIQAPISSDVRPNDILPTGGTYTFSVFTPPNAAQGSVVFNPNGTFTFSPATGFLGTTSFKYRVCNQNNICDTATVFIRVRRPALAAVNDTIYTFMDVPVSGNVQPNDTLPLPGTYNFSIITSANPTQGNVVFGSNGAFNFTPATGFIGTTSFRYRVCNQNNFCDTATVLIIVGLPAVVAVNDTVNTTSPAPISGSVRPNDILPLGGIYTFSLLTPVLASQGIVSFSAVGGYTYTPAAGFVGTASFVYRVCNQFNECSNATVFIRVAPPLPIAVNDTVTTTSGVNINSDVKPNDILPLGGIYTFSLVSGVPAAEGTVTVNANGTYTFSPASGFVGTSRFSYKVCNQNNFCDTAIVVVNVLPAVPIAQDDTASTFKNISISRSVKPNDILPIGGIYTYSLVSAMPASQGSVTLNPDGSYSFVPAAGFVGNTSFVYKVCNQTNQCSNASVNIRVLEPPVPLKIPEGFSPNNDGVNDNFVIEGRNNRILDLKVFNRWGNLVYENQNYQDEWNGTANRGMRVNDQLPDGTYFYIIEFKDKGERYNRAITIKR